MSAGGYVAGMRRKVGWFVILGIGAVLLLLLAITVRTDVFAKKFDLFVSPPSATAFAVGQEVRFQGFAIGRVHDIELQPHGGVRITLRLLERYHGMIHQGAVVRLVKEGFIGHETVEITSGKPEAPVLPAGTEVPYQTEATLDQLLLDLKPAVTNADTLLRELVKLAKWLNDPNGDVRQATANLRRATAGVKKGAVQKAMTALAGAAGEMQKLAGQLNRHQAARHLADSLQQTATILKDIEPLTHRLGEEGPETLEQVNRLLARLDKLTVSLNHIAADMEEMTPELPGLARESRDTIAEIQKLIQALRGSWLFGGAPPPEASGNEVAPPPVDSRP